jgi:hypothetical protein
MLIAPGRSTSGPIAHCGYTAIQSSSARARPTLLANASTHPTKHAVIDPVLMERVPV